MKASTLKSITYSSKEGTGFLFNILYDDIKDEFYKYNNATGEICYVNENDLELFREQNIAIIFRKIFKKK